MGAAAPFIPAIVGAGVGLIGNKSGGSQKNVTTTTEVPPWVRDAMQWNINAGQGYAQRPYTPYPGQRFEGFNPMQMNAMGSANLYGQMGLGALGQGYNAMMNPMGQNMMGNAYGMMGNSYGMMGNAYNNLGGMSNMAMGMAQNPFMPTPMSQAMFVDPSTAAYGNTAQVGRAAQTGPASLAQLFQGNASLANRGDIQNVDGGSFLDMNIGDYMNPYTQNVVDNVLADNDLNWRKTVQAQKGDAIGAAAFGGSREGVEKAVTAGEFNRNAGMLSSRLWNDAYMAGTNLAGQDLQRAIQADLANQGMDWNVSNLNANLGTNTSLQNAQMGNQNSQFNAGQQNQMDMFNTGQQNQVSMYDVGQMNNMNQFNAEIANKLGMFNAELGTLNNQFNTGNVLQNQQFGQNFGLNALQQAMSGQNVMGNIGQGMGTIGQGMGNLGYNMGTLGINQGQALADFGLGGLRQQMAAGNMMQGLGQQQRDWDYQQFLEARDWYPNQFGYALSPLQGQNFGSSTTQPYFGPSGFQNALGGAMMGMGMYNQFFGGPGGGGGMFSTPYTPSITGMTVPGSGGQSPQDFYSYPGG